jgi:outer membrane protein OmpA-like peptidoglycan-associated protein
MERHSFIRVFLLILILNIFNPIYAAPSMTGGRGLFLVEDARTSGAGVITVSSFLTGYEHASKDYRGDIILPNVTYAPWKFTELFFHTGMVVDSSNVVWPEIWQSKFSRMNYGKVIGGKLTIPILPVLKLGVKADYTWQTPALISPQVLEHEDGFAWTGLVTLQFNELISLLPNLTVNYSENSDMRDYGAGLEIAGSYGALFVEATSEEPKSVARFDQVLDNIFITPGLRINMDAHSNISAGVILNVKNHPGLPKYTGILGLTLGSAFFQPKETQYGIFTGTVTDAQTGTALLATINFPSHPKLSSILSNGQTGIFMLENIPSGVLIAEVEAPGYQKKISSVTIKGDQVVAYDFKLEPVLIKDGIIVGNVYDEETGRPLVAQIIFSDASLPIVNTDSLSGAFRIDKVPAGIISLDIKKQGYYTKTQTISVQAELISELEVRLVPAFYKGSIIGRVSEVGTGNSLKATLSFPGTDIKTISSDAVSGVYFAELPAGIYPVVVSALGYNAVTNIIEIEKNRPVKQDIELSPAQISVNSFIGKVMERNTSKPLKAVITFPGTMLASISTDSVTGTFQTQLPVGSYLVTVAADGYHTLSEFVTVEKERASERNFQLTLLEMKSKLIGRVTDKNTGKSLWARVSFPEALMPMVMTDSLSGVYETELPVGSYVANVTSDGYLSQTAVVILEKDKITEKNFELFSEEYKSILFGRVVDANTNSGVKAVITIPELQMMQIKTESITGIYRAELAYGTYTLNVNASGYAPQSTIVVLEKEQALENNFSLNPMSVKSTLIGRVIDKKSGQGLQALITFPNTALIAVVSDSLTGIYQTELPVGSYAVNISADGYISSSAIVIIEQGKTLERNFELVEKGMTITLKGVYFEPGKATLKPESYPALQQAAKILTDNSGIKVEIQGHTDNTGSVQLNQRLSQERADAVMNYLVKSLGISPERLTAQGYGPSQPIASNDNAEGRALNRRVDFKILE